MAIGYACIALGLSRSGMRSCTLKNVTPEKLNELIASNLQTLSRLFDYNLSRGIRIFRISSDIIPFGSHPAVRQSWWIDHADTLHELGERINRQGIRVSMHPGQYTVLNAQDPVIAERAAADLAYHARFLDSLGLDEQHKIILHAGGVYTDPETSLVRFKKHFQDLPSEIKRRLVLENDEKYHIGQVLQLALELQIPAVFDVFHHQCYPAPEDRGIFQWLERCRATWQPADGVQKIHYSQQQTGLRSGAHAYSVQLQPFLDFYQNLPNRPLDIMLECKDKDLSAIKCQLAVKQSPDRKALEQEWARYKYLIMEHSPRHYQAIGKVFGADQVNAQTFYLMIEEALHTIPTQGQVLNAAQHVWGYVSEGATVREKRAWEQTVDRFLSGEIEKTRLKAYLHRLAEKYGFEYLLESYYFLASHQ